jgi:hypothetical protein
MASAYFRRTIEDLSKNFIIYICVRTPPQRRIIKLAYEGQVRFRRPRGRFQRIWQSLGWRPWQVDLRIGAKGGSHHLEVTAPPGVDIGGITADPSWTEGRDEIGRSHRWRSLWAWLRGIVVWSPDAAVAVTVLAVLSAVVMGLMTISRVFPIARPPHRESGTRPSSKV